jgi:acyl-CoA thioester hydrolase
MNVAVFASSFIWPVRVYWEDTDAGGVVYYANYLKFLERARTEWLRALGVEQMPLKEQYGVLMVVARVEASYRRPARYGDELQVCCRVVELGKASMSFEQRISRAGNANDGEGELLLDAQVKVACIDATSFKPRALPDVLIGSLKKE